ncbi:AAA family ATPase [Lysobacter korlensis]|uniref:AAA family ATPase n=1 Tax=Lysobacter korlensis TaxID=553636 RepID=A0ABV6RID6_9GAMM
MQAVIFCGIQGSGKSTFYLERFFDTHLRINLDMLRTRHRERRLLAACIDARQRFVIDNTNPTVEERARYIAPALAAGFEVTGYFFATDPRAAFERNQQRSGRVAVPAAGVFGTYKRLQPPTPDEGFARIDRVELVPPRGFVVTPMRPPA